MKLLHDFQSLLALKSNYRRTERLARLPSDLSPPLLLRQGNPHHLNEEKLRSRMYHSAAVIRPLKSTCIRCMDDLLFSNSVNLSEVMEYFRVPVQNMC